jgi:hypothetical protein
MSYYPILSSPRCNGWVDLCNFAPNDWEITDKTDAVISVNWAKDDIWHSEMLGLLKPGNFRRVHASDVASIVPDSVLPILSMSSNVLPEKSRKIPGSIGRVTVAPSWRATIGLDSEAASTSYQGELDPFSPNGSLLTFGPFLQFGSDIENYLILVNLESSPRPRTASLEIYNAEQMRILDTKIIQNNSVNIINLDSFGFIGADLPVFICKEMSGIPLYFSATSDRQFLSLEHSHPPASSVVHGDRLEVQRLLKRRWFMRATGC